MSDRRRSALSVLAGVGIVVSTGFILFSRWANSPVSTVGSVGVPEGVVEGESVEVGTKAYATSFYATEVPLQYSIKSASEQQGGPVLAQVLFSGTSSSPGSQIADQLAITVGVLPNDALEGVSAVMMRSRSPDHYDPINFEWLPAGAKAFKKSGAESEISIFFGSSTRYAAVVVGGSPQRLDSLEKVLQHIVATWQWN